MAAITAVQKNCENRKIPNPSLIGIAQVFSPQIRRKLEFSSIIPYNDSTVSLCATKAAVWVYSHAAFFLFHTSEADCMFYSDTVSYTHLVLGDNNIDRCPNATLHSLSIIAAIPRIAPSRVYMTSPRSGRLR